MRVGTKLVTVKLPRTFVEIIDELVDAGMYESRSQFIRIAVRRLLEEHARMQVQRVRRVTLWTT